MNANVLYIALWPSAPQHRASVVSPLPNEVEALKTLVVSMTQCATEVEAEMANASAKASTDQALIAQCHRTGAAMRHFLRKSWLFCGSDRGGQRAAVM